MANSEQLPAWLTEGCVNFYANEFGRSRFVSGLNWYRNIDRNWELTAPFTGLPVTVPALYVAGDRDLVVRFRSAPELIVSLKKFVPTSARRSCRPAAQLDAVGRPAELNARCLRSREACSACVSPQSSNWTISSP